MARRLGYGMFELDSLGMAALLKDIGYVLVGDDENGADRSEREESRRIRQHPSHGSRILAQSQGFSSETINAVLQHHERWDGSGYPEGLKADAISPFARIIAIADTYCELLSAKPKRRALMPHEAIEYVMAFSAEWFDPEMVQLFVRQVPLYPSGLMVRLNTKEVGIVSDANVGHIGRPVVRICQDIHGQEIDRPYDVDLSGSKQQDLLIVGVLER